jgi:hypothetical protein
MFVGKARSLPQSGVHERCFTWIGITLKHYTILERVARDKHSNLLRKLVTYSRKRYYNIGPCSQYYKTFLGVIYATSEIFPYDFD